MVHNNKIQFCDLDHLDYAHFTSVLFVLKKHVDNIPAKDFIAGPLNGIYEGGGKWEFLAYASQESTTF